MNASARAVLPARGGVPEPPRRLFVWLAVGIAAVALVGFAGSYYLKSLTGTPPLPLAVHLHGLIMSAWLAVFVAQTWLIAVGRTQWHRRLGVAGAVLAALVILYGIALTVLALEREIQAHVLGKWHFLLLINAVNLVLFGALVGSGLLLRRRPDVHKRLMLLAAVTLLAPAAARVALLFAHGPLPQFLAFYSCLVACVLADTLWSRRLHPVLGFGAIGVIAAFQLSFFAVQTRAWMAVVRMMFGG